ncbi:hypothetical protein PybrP1_003784 [[Pythium] brassicae (nom. inval.)]|nr:hypothetical protein PybrP1_003784 [[Pythium] brassicae (nom. inval.)]
MDESAASDVAWASENHWRRTFCQIPFADIYAHAEQGKRSLLGLVAFFRRKALAERAASDELRVLLHTPPLPSSSSSGSPSASLEGGGALEELEESGSSIRRALAEVKSFVDAACNHQLLLATVLEEQVAEPLAALQEASEVYVRVLRDEIKSVNDEYAAAAAAHRHAAARLRKAMDELADARERQRAALHGIGVPAFELQRLAARVAKCEDEKLQAEMAKAQSKSALYHRIVARDEMAMAVSVAYQKAEEERLDQLRSSLQRFLHVEKDRLKASEKMLASLEEHIGHIDRSEDIQLLIHNRRNPDNMHFQGKALALLDWHWGKMRTEQEQTRRRGHSVEQGVYDASAGSSEPMRGRGGVASDPHHVSFSAGSGDSADAVVVYPAAGRDAFGAAVATKPLHSPHGELAQSPMSIALRQFFASDATGTAFGDHENLEPREDGRSVNDTATPHNEVEESAPDASASLSPTSDGAASGDGALPPAQDELVGKQSPKIAASAVVKSACAHQAGRAMFVKCLNRQRSLETKVRDRASFEALVDCFDVFLSECIREDDVKAAKTAMILAETFYLPRASGAAPESGAAAAVGREDWESHEDHHHLHHNLQCLPHHHGGVDRGATRMYLQEEVKRHAIWKNPSFWEKALLLAIGEELQKTPQHAPWEDLPSGVPKQDTAGLPTREEAVGRVHNIVFGQLGSFTLSMLEFEVPLPQIESFVETMCDAHELTEDQRFLLRKSLQEIFATLR